MYGVMVAARLLLLGCWLQFMTDNVFGYCHQPGQVHRDFWTGNWEVWFFRGMNEIRSCHVGL